MSDDVDLRKLKARDYARRYRATNPDKAAEAIRRCRAANPQKYVEIGRRYRAANAEKIAEAKRRYRTENPDKVAETKRRYRIANADKIYEAQRQYRVANPDKYNKAKKRYLAANPDKALAMKQARRAREKNASGSISAAEISALRTKLGKRCAACGVKGRMTIDHIVPLARGGAHAISNIQFLCQPCNSSKNAKDPIDWAREQGRLC